MDTADDDMGNLLRTLLPGCMGATIAKGRVNKGMTDVAVELLNELRILVDAMEELDMAVADQYGINRTDMRCLELLRLCGPMQPKDLAGAMRYTSGGMTAVIDRLVAAGYVERLPSANDQRAILVCPIKPLSPPPWQKAAEECASDYPNDDLVRIRNGCVMLRRILKGYRERMG